MLKRAISCWECGGFEREEARRRRGGEERDASDIGKNLRCGIASVATGSVSAERPRHPETDACVSIGGRAHLAVGGANILGPGAPRTPAQHALRAVSRQQGHSVAGRVPVVGVPAILHPFGDVAMNIEKAPWIDGASVRGRRTAGNPTGT